MANAENYYSRALPRAQRVLAFWKLIAERIYRRLKINRMENKNS
jgi:hypothetical protein